MTNVLTVNQIKKSYDTGPEKVTVWGDVNFQVNAGEAIAIVGASGSGKTTLLNVLGGLDTVDSGDVLINDQSIHGLADNERTRVRNQHLGFVYQFHHLLAEFSAVENVAMPLLLAGVRRSDALEKAKSCLSELGLAHRFEHRPSELSGGERQRTAVARALVHEPSIVLMDEPTGNLDNESAAVVEQLIDDLRQRLSTAFVLVTHDRQLAERMDRSYLLHNKELTLIT